DEPVAKAQSLGDLLAPFVGIGRDGDDLDAGSLGLGQLGSKPLELRHAERSPVAAIEDQHDRLLAAVILERYRSAGRIGQREVGRSRAPPQRRRGTRTWPTAHVAPPAAADREPRGPGPN